MYDLHSFGLKEMIHSGRQLRKLGTDSQSMDEAAGEIVDVFFERFVDSAGQPNCALVRCFKTHPYSGLPPELQQTATSGAPQITVPPDTQCLCLLASRGVRAEWNCRKQSAEHRVIPLLSPETLDAAPMIANLFHQMGMEIGTVLGSRTPGVAGLLVGPESPHFNVFHVADALGSEFLPAQESFVRPNGVKSVVGFGGSLAPNELFAIVLFSRVPIERETAQLFRTLALGAKLVLLPFAGRQIFH